MAAGGFLIRRIKRLKHGAILFLVLLAVLFVYFPDYAKLRKLRKENARLAAENKRLETAIADYEEKLLRVGKDPYLYERMARDELGIAKDNEIVIDIEQ